MGMVYPVGVAYPVGVVYPVGVAYPMGVVMRCMSVSTVLLYFLSSCSMNSRCSWNLKPRMGSS